MTQSVAPFGRCALGYPTCAPLGLEGAGGDNGADGTPPPVDPNLAARQFCVSQYMAPKSQCTSPAPPMGNSLTSCLQQLSALYSACIAAIGN